MQTKSYCFHYANVVVFNQECYVSNFATKDWWRKGYHNLRIILTKNFAFRLICFAQIREIWNAVLWNCPEFTSLHSWVIDNHANNDFLTCRNKILSKSHLVNRYWRWFLTPIANDDSTHVWTACYRVRKVEICIKVATDIMEILLKRMWHCYLRGTLWGSYGRTVLHLGMGVSALSCRAIGPDEWHVSMDSTTGQSGLRPPLKCSTFAM